MTDYPVYSYVYGRVHVGVRLVYKQPVKNTDIFAFSTFVLQNAASCEWAMLGSNQRPLPCEGKFITSWLFTAVQKYLQNELFSLRMSRGCSRAFAWVGVLLV